MQEVEIISPQGEVSYRRPIHQTIVEGLVAAGYRVRLPGFGEILLIRPNDPADETPDSVFLRMLAQALREIPASYGTDDYHVSRLLELADQVEVAELLPRPTTLAEMEAWCNKTLGQIADFREGKGVKLTDILGPRASAP